MSVCNDGLVICDSCRELHWDRATYVELWPEREHDPGFHICLGCLRRQHTRQYLAEIGAMDALHRERQAVVTGPERAAPRPPRSELAGRQPIPRQRQEDLTLNAAEMTAYVIAGAGRLTGPQLPVYNAREIFEAFIARFGSLNATRIARAAIEVHNGMWRGAPITPVRFQPAHDDYFAKPVLALLDQAEHRTEE